VSHPSISRVRQKMGLKLQAAYGGDIAGDSRQADAQWLGI